MAEHHSTPRRLTVGDVMTHPVVSIASTATYGDVERLMAAHHISAVPVLDGGQLVGIVSQADLLLKTEGPDGQQPHRFAPARRRRMQVKAAATTAEHLMSSPVITVAPDATVAAAARLMRRHSVKRLVVCDPSGMVGIASRADLISAFVRSDADLHDEVVHAVMENALWMDPHTVEVTVDDGTVQLVGRVERRSEAEILVHVVRGLEGVLSVESDLDWSFDDRSVDVGHEAHVR